MKAKLEIIIHRVIKTKIQCRGALQKVAQKTQRHVCQGNRFIFVIRHGDHRGCHRSDKYANIRKIGMADFLESGNYAEHRRLLMKCNIYTSECS